MSLYFEGGMAYHEDSYVSDRRLLESYLETLHYRSFSMTRDVPRPLDVMENELIVRWRDIIAALPRETSDEDYGYSQKQLEYFSMILEQVLRAKNALLQVEFPRQDSLLLVTAPDSMTKTRFLCWQNYPDNYSYSNFSELSYCMTEQVENLVFLLKLILTQAKNQSYPMANRKLRMNDRHKESKKRRHCNTSSQFDYSVGLLIDAIARDRETANMDLESSPIMTKILLQWLYFGRNISIHE